MPHNLYNSQQKLNLVSDAKQGRKKENLGKNINSESNDIMPVLSADGQTMYFVRKKYEGNIGPAKKDDVWVSTQGPEGWSLAQNLGAPINNDDFNFVILCHNEKMCDLHPIAITDITGAASRQCK